jgi:hypothetical protein
LCFVVKNVTVKKVVDLNSVKPEKREGEIGGTYKPNILAY